LLPLGGKKEFFRGKESTAEQWGFDRGENGWIKGGGWSVFVAVCRTWSAFVRLAMAAGKMGAVRIGPLNGPFICGQSWEGQVVRLRSALFAFFAFARLLAGDFLEFRRLDRLVGSPFFAFFRQIRLISPFGGGAPALRKAKESGKLVVFRRLASLPVAWRGRGAEGRGWKMENGEWQKRNSAYCRLAVARRGDAYCAGEEISKPSARGFEQGFHGKCEAKSAVDRGPTFVSLALRFSRIYKPHITRN
jgi:hypothetical protein